MKKEVAEKKVVNLFEAGTSIKKPASAKKEHKTIAVPSLGDKIQKFVQVKNEIKAKEAEKEMLEGDIKTIGKETFLKEYKAQRSTPENFSMQDKTGSVVMLIVQDKYTKVDETKAEVLNEYEGLVAEEVVYTIAPAMVQKYGEVLSNMIMESKKIAEEDKVNIIKGEKSFSVAKGSIDRLLQYPNPDEVFQLINPVVMLK